MDPPRALSPPSVSRPRASRDGRGQGEDSGGSAGHVLAIIRASDGLTRAEIIERTGLSRSTVGNRLDALHAAGLISLGSPTSAARGRPPTQFHFRADRGVLLIAEAGATGVRLALTDLAGTIRDQAKAALEVTLGPKDWLARVEALFDDLLARAGRDAGAVKGIGIALPGPVDFERGVVVSPPIMTGWDGYPIRSWFAERFDCPVLVDNDANAMTVGEHRASHADRSSMVMLKLATGIGAGIIAGGQIYRGADGAAGDIGHIQISPPDQGPAPLCRCGNLGCIEAYAGGWALIRDLNAGGRAVSSVAEVVALVGSGDPLATALSRRAGRLIGIALSDAVSLLNPGVVVVGGELAAAANELFAGIRESVYARSLPLATRRLEIVAAQLGDVAGVSGLAATLTDHIFEAARIDAALA
ncbi:MAG TPA: ROK family transcriptional regulator [Dermatophilaceae bacterium]|nr:ROK family transcriptional regulator [Dermatophilaceae bacterium]